MTGNANGGIDLLAKTMRHDFNETVETPAESVDDQAGTTSRNTLPRNADEKLPTAD